jgi:hydrogenase maturation protein HypF
VRELFDPADRRHRYPFIACAECGPRVSIAGIEVSMCARCAAECRDRGDRRYGAAANGCPDCGPRLREPLATAVAALQAGGVAALEGTAAVHLACRAGAERAVARLRARDPRPLAVMAADLAAAGELAVLGPVEAALLGGPDRPVVRAPRRHDAPVAADLAPGGELGLMLPHCPVHHLLLADVGAPLAMAVADARPEDALERLAGIADAFVLSDRPPRVRMGDSVLRVARGRPLPLRRSRGAVPSLLGLPVPAARAVLARGAGHERTYCLARGRRAWLSHPVGDLDEGVALFERLLEVVPEVVAEEAGDDEGGGPVVVQHHHAHLAACLAEHGETGPAAAAIFDGGARGADGTVWGGELLVGGLDGFERAGHLWPVGLPGREPWEMACAWLMAAEYRVARPVAGVDPARWHAVERMLDRGTPPMTTSAGRLLDAVAALCGLRAEAAYDGQAAAELEAACDHAERRAYPLDVVAGVLDARETVHAIARDAARGEPPGTIAARFHHALADATADACAGLAGARGLDTVVLGGDTFGNRRLLERTAARLEAAGLRVLTPTLVPPGDGGIAYGQAAIAAVRGSDPLTA